MKLLVIILCGLFRNFTTAKDEVTIDFVSTFIANEHKPTHLIFGGLCWQKHVELKLVNEMFKLGIRVSSSLAAKPKYQDHAILYLTDLDCYQSTETIYQAISQKLFQLSYRWLVLVSSDISSKWSPILYSPVLADSDLVMAERTADQYKMFELHKPSLNATMQMSLRGFYRDFNFTDVRHRRELYQRRKDLMGYPIVMSATIQDSNSTRYHMPRLDRQKIHHDSVTKVCWAAAVHMYEMLNATPQYIYSYRFGYKVNGSWSGMIDDLYQNKADFGTNCIIFNERLDVATYTDFLGSIKFVFVFRQPPLVYVANIFYLPFSTNVWTMILVCTALSTLAVYLASKWEVAVERIPMQLDGGIGDALLLSFSAFTQQGCYIEPKRTPGRIMTFVLFTALMALYAAYSANIVVLLQAPSNSIQTLSQLAAAKIALGGTKSDYQRFILNQINDPLHNLIRDRILPEGGTPKLYDIEEGVERVRKGFFALHSLISPVYHQIQSTFLESEKCDITTIDILNSFESFTPVRKDSPYLELIRVAFKRIKESGIHSAILKRYIPQKPRCTNHGAAFTSVGIQDLEPVMIIMLYGVMLSISIAIGEIIVYKLMRNGRKKKTSTNKITFQK